MQMTVNERVKFYRTKVLNRMSQEEFAKPFGMTPQNISRIENGSVSPSIEFIKIMEDHYGANRDWLLDGEGPMEKKDVGTGRGMFPMNSSEPVISLSAHQQIVDDLLKQLNQSTGTGGKIVASDVSLVHLMRNSYNLNWGANSGAVANI